MLLIPTISTTYIWMNRPIGQISRNLKLELFSASVRHSRLYLEPMLPVYPMVDGESSH